MQIYTIRHTAVALAQGICYGQSEVPLAIDFQLDFNRICQQLPTDFDVIFSSPLQRCQRLALALEKHADDGLGEVSTHPALMEVNFGDWELKNWSDIPQHQSQAWMDDYVNQSPPNGESLQMLYQRVQLFLDDLRAKPHQKVLIVAHAGVVRCIWAYVLGLPLQNIFKINIQFGQITAFKFNANPAMDALLWSK